MLKLSLIGGSLSSWGRPKQHVLIHRGLAGARGLRPPHAPQDRDRTTSGSGRLSQERALLSNSSVWVLAPRTYRGGRPPTLKRVLLGED